MGYADSEESPMTVEKFAAGVCLAFMIAACVLAIFGRCMGEKRRRKQRREWPGLLAIFVWC